MKKFIIAKNEFLKKETQAYYRCDYTTFGTEGNPDFINHLKNQFGNTNFEILKKAVDELIHILLEDLPKIKSQQNTNLAVCVIPRAKSENQYSDNQRFFKRVISSVLDVLSDFTNGTNYIIRQINTRTTHMNRSGYGGDGDMPYVGITKATCKISGDVRGKDILLIDDIYTLGVNIDEDAIQALLDSGANSVIFYAVAKTYKGGFKQVVRPQVNINDDDDDGLPF
jgi:phosphoribosylpyrophosphate synthetase